MTHMIEYENSLRDFTKTKFDVIITAGQSNCEGAGIGDVETPFEPQEDIWFMNRNGTISQAAEKLNDNLLCGSFKLIFADHYKKGGNLANDRELILIDAAVGATGFEKGMWGKEEALTKDLMRMTQTVLNLNPGNKIVAFLWHQGERSINFNVKAEFHKQELKILLDDFIACFGKKYPFIAGDFVQSWKMTKGEQGIAIADAIQEVFCDEYHGGFVQTQGLHSNSEDCKDSVDVIHFSRKSCYELGSRYYETYNHLMKAARNAEYLDRIDRSIDQVVHGKVITQSFLEIEEMMNE
ncbi:MAG: sialate O-acetylesterase [Lachnospiraceae bacterium]